MRDIFRAAVYLLIIMSTTWGCKTSKSTRTHSPPKKTVKPETPELDGITKSEDIGGLVKMMTGQFSTGVPSDSTLMPQTLHMTPIWTAKEAKYLYAEQYPSADPQSPSLQLIYKVQKDNQGGFKIDRYLLKDALAALGQWKTPTYFDTLDDSHLSLREGCSLYLIQHTDGSFSGSTRMRECESKREGSTYSTTIIKIRPDSFVNWEQGFDAAKKLMWGDASEGSRFVRQDNQ